MRLGVSREAFLRLCDVPTLQRVDIKDFNSQQALQYQAYEVAAARARGLPGIVVPKPFGELGARRSDTRSPPGAWERVRSPPSALQLPWAAARRRLGCRPGPGRDKRRPQRLSLTALLALPWLALQGFSLQGFSQRMSRGQTATMSGDYEDDLCRRALILVSDLCARVRDADTSDRCQEFNDLRIRGYPRGPDADISVSLLSVIVTFCGIVLLGVSLFVSWKLCWVPWRDKGGSAVGGPGSGLLLLPPSAGGLPSAQSHQQVTSLAPATRYPALPRPLTQQTLTSQPDPSSEERPPALPLPLPGGEEKAKLIGQIKPELYQGTGPGGRRGGGAPGSGEAGSGAPCGRISFALRYLYGSDQLVVRILQALDLPAKDSNGFSDPYVKIYLLPDRKKKFQTKVHWKTLNPVFNETFQFAVPLAELAQRKLHFSVYDFDRFSRHDLIGQVVLDNLLELAEQPPDRPLWRDIVEGGSEKADLGELNFSLCYLPTAGRLTVTIIKASNLKAMDLTGFSDPYVKASLISEGRRLKKRKTSIKKNTLNPTYNEALVFDVAPESVENVGLSIAVVDYDCIGHNEVIGVCRVGPPVEHWHQLVEEKTLTSFTKGSKGLSEKESSE
ncbi:Synaptotagmin-3 [Tupaia chinensis]|uniref:Synaptotagmin-3 n=1 Tax=Tupaia chinensis TaxID=246437 RepID=L9L663_TUPCH|nr:Synaptotagmin-3 [Tupaia chinensis]